MPIKPCAEKTVLDTITSYIDFLPIVFSVLLLSQENSKLSGELCKTSHCTGRGGNQIRFYIVFQRQNLDFCICFIIGCILEAKSRSCELRSREGTWHTHRSLLTVMSRKRLLLRLGTRQGCLHSLLLFSIAMALREEKEKDSKLETK